MIGAPISSLPSNLARFLSLLLYSFPHLANFALMISHKTGKDLAILQGWCWGCTIDPEQGHKTRNDLQTMSLH